MDLGIQKWKSFVCYYQEFVISEFVITKFHCNCRYILISVCISKHCKKKLYYFFMLINILSVIFMLIKIILVKFCEFYFHEQQTINPIILNFDKLAFRPVVLNHFLFMYPKIKIGPFHVP
jgi:hypothetical protein